MERHNGSVFGNIRALEDQTERILYWFPKCSFVAPSLCSTRSMCLFFLPRKKQIRTE